MLINKDDLPLVAMEFMNNTHFEDVDIINELYDDMLNYEKDASNDNLSKLESKYKEWVEHTIQHFATEEEEMIAKGFFAYGFHKSEHEANLYEITQLWSKFEGTKDINILKNYFEKALVSWLVNHIQTIYTVTSMFFKTVISPFLIH